MSMLLDVILPVFLVIGFGALAAARQQQIVHGDLKAGNVLITAEGRAKLTDFGLSKLQKEAEKMKRDVGLDNDHTNDKARDILTAGTTYIFSEIKNVLFDFEKEYKVKVF